MTLRFRHNLSSWLSGLALLYGLGFFSPANADDREVLIGMRAIQGNEIALQRWGATTDYLNDAVPGYRFRLIPYDTLNAILEAAENKQFQFVFTNPSSFVEMNLRFNAQSLLTLINQRHNTAQTRFGSVIFTHVENTDIVKLKDLHGKRFMAVSEPAFGGWQVGWLELMRHGIDPYDDFSQLRWGNGNQHNVVYAVRDKKVDAGIVRTDMLERMQAKQLIDLRTFRILNSKDSEGFPFFHSTPLYPEWPFAAMPSAPAELQLKVKQALLEMPSEHPAARRGQYVGWTDSLSYEPVRQLMQELTVGPYQSRTNTTSISLNWLLLVAVILLGLLVAKNRTRNR